MVKHIPNFITLLNLSSGFLAVILASQGHVMQACYLIIAGMVFDFADGFSARMLKAYSAIGKDLDSLADVVTFGAAPGAVIFVLLAGKGLPLPVVIALAAILPAASALRLAKFNNDAEQKTYFKGMATPASAFTLISFVIASYFSDWAVYDKLLGSAWFIGGLSLFLSGMMLVSLRMFSLKFPHLRLRGNEDRYIFVILSMTLIVVFGFASPPMIMTAYILISLLFALIRRTGAAA